jgi:hypothetical protein
MKKTLLLLCAFFFIFHSFIILSVSAKDENRMRFLLETKMEKIHSTDIGSDFIKKMQKLKTSKRNTLKQKFKIHKKLSKYIIGKKEKNIASVL